MIWNKKELKKEFIIRSIDNDDDFEMVNGDWVHTKREIVEIDCDQLMRKKNLSEHEEYELLICNNL